ncbi:MAG: protease modulator HflC [Thermoanaerobaculia bacterium]
MLAVLALERRGLRRQREAEQVVITMFGEPIGDPIVTPGLHWKLPFFQDAHRFDKRFLEWDGEANQPATRDKRFIFVDTFARWRHPTAPLLPAPTAGRARAQSRLDDIDGETRNAANHDLVEVVRSSNREPQEDETVVDQAETFQQIEIGREKIRSEILERAKERTADLGIEILDVQFKRINYVEDVQQGLRPWWPGAAHRRPLPLRGRGEAARIHGERERELKRIQSEAYREAEEIRGKADAQATQVYASAYDQSADSLLLPVPEDHRR